MQHGGDVRQFTEGQPFASEVDLRLLPQDRTGRTDTQRGFHRRGASFSVSPKLLGLVNSPLLFAQVRQPFGKIEAVPNISDGKPLSQELFGPTPIP